MQAAAAVCFAVAAAVIAVNLARGRATPDLADLLFVGIPVLVAGQLWCIAILLARRPASAGGRWFRAPEPGVFFDGLRRWETAVVSVLFVAVV